MLGMLKSISRKVAKEQSQNWHQTLEDLNGLPVEVKNHLSLDRGRKKTGKSCERPSVRTALIV